ncbi:hypothetical protein O2604_17025 [Pseudomonas aeruginosa]|uniref:hypothetical protein n=1 Tax=Pseudomonas aeruginosa TaxID=287 RepID=UPI0020434F6D|nr:hypothetical protein [Pseudomonas aeruginosa]MCM3971823.1 hypothetical protein [Pseudomonas aeruginosa]MCM4037986.1 hypothetical protein [Pseudomonas aeruginosa]MCM4055686.1 hypothetical protein [Pseudomonas aeruginosa]WAW38764.1 hypothetical protein O2604_17025 [Pseudomonas aeruginosa]WRS37016.1 hypothetical protein U9S62_13370 [Pseudomonas aeruginosa]
MNKTSVLVRILLAGSEGNTASSAWVDADMGCGGYGVMSKDERFKLDCEYRRHLRQNLTPRFWDALIARYALDINDRGKAIRGLGRVVATHAHQHFKFYAVLTWAERQKVGAGKRSTGVLKPDFYDMNRWDDNHGTPERTRRRWRAGIHEALDGILSDAIASAVALLEEQGMFERMAA